jgi:ribonuclease D
MAWAWIFLLDSGRSTGEGDVVYSCVIDTDEKLAAFLPRLAEADWIAVDTEADSLHAYPEKLCLIQISITGSDELLDPLSAMDLGPLMQILHRHELIFHGADYDLRLLRKACGFVPSAISDTMLASRLLGYREFGLNHLVSKYLGVPLEKGPQKANWARRPLTSRMETYARNDTHYLKPLSDLLQAQLKEKGRLGWHRETCARLVADCAQFRPTDPDLAWRVKGSHQLSPAALAVLREIWQWREREAIEANKPPYFVLAPETMVELAMAAVESRDVQAILPRHLWPRRRERLLKAIATGLAAEDPPKILRHKSTRQTEAEKRRMNDLEKRRNLRATELDLDPTLIASRAMLVMLARDWAAHEKALMPWQKALLVGGES